MFGGSCHMIFLMLKYYVIVKNKMNFHFFCAVFVIQYVMLHLCSNTLKNAGLF